MESGEVSLRHHVPVPVQEQVIFKEIKNTQLSYTAQEEPVEHLANTFNQTIEQVENNKLSNAKTFLVILFILTISPFSWYFVHNYTGNSGAVRHLFLK